MRKVLDLSRLLPGPWAGMRLAEQGLEVLKIELPHFPDPLADHWINKGKRRLVLDFSKPAGAAKLSELIEQSDVLLESFRPGQLERMGFGPDKLKKLVYCTIGGYENSAKAAHDLNVLASTGWLGLSPVPPPTQVADLACGEAAAVAVLGALLRGEPRRIVMTMEGAMRRWYPLPGLFDGDPYYRVYQAKDGPVAVAAVEPAFKSALRAFLGITEDSRLAEAIAQKTVAELEAKDFCVNGVRKEGTASPSAAESRTKAA